MAIFRLRNQHYDHSDIGGGSPLLRYFIRTPTFVFDTYSLLETVRIAFIPATNNAIITLNIFYDNFRFSKKIEKTFTINATVFEAEFAIQATVKDCVLDFAFVFNTHTGQIPTQDELLPKQNNAGYFEPLFCELIFQPGERV